MAVNIMEGQYIICFWLVSNPPPLLYIYSLVISYYDNTLKNSTPYFNIFCTYSSKFLYITYFYNEWTMGPNVT